MARVVKNIFDYRNAATAPLVVDALYAGDDVRHQDTLPRLLKVGVQGGFRQKGPRPHHFVVLTTSGREPEWPDVLDPSTGRFVYFGDNREPGRALHEPRGNQILERIFKAIHADPPRRDQVPPFFVFRTRRGLLDPPARSARDLLFLGLAVPGGPDVGEADDLVATWRTKQGLRFQNYRAVFTILDANPIEREWLDSLIDGTPVLDRAPSAWKEWVLNGRYRALSAPEPPQHRTEEEQWPQTEEGVRIINAIRSHFLPSGAKKADATRFEPCAALLWKMACQESVTYSEITRPVVDGGRDAIGELRIGPPQDPLSLDFSLEAKLYNFEAGHRVGTSDTKRLIARLRHRQFGVLVTTSVVGRQAYLEIREDQQPVVILAARDIVDVLARHTYTTADAVVRWLEEEFPVS